MEWDLTAMRHVYRAAGYLLNPRIALPSRFAGENERKLHPKTVLPSMITLAGPDISNGWELYASSHEPAHVLPHREGGVWWREYTTAVLLHWYCSPIRRQCSVIHCLPSLVPRPKQPQRRSLPVSRTGKEGLGIWPRITWIFGMSIIHLLMTSFPQSFMEEKNICLHMVTARMFTSVCCAWVDQSMALHSCFICRRDPWLPRSSDSSQPFKSTGCQ